VKAPENGGKKTWGLGGPAVRLGLRMIKGLAEAHGQKIVQARREPGAYESIDEFHALTELPVAAVSRLSAADAFGSIPKSRRMALGETLALPEERRPLSNPGEKIRNRGKKEPDPMLPGMSMGEEIQADYASSGLSLKGHPVELFRKELAERKVTPAAEVWNHRHGKWIKVAGLVIIRQRPGTAKGIVFETIEDETGIVNLIIRPDVYAIYRQAARNASMVQADGYVERQGKVLHVMVVRLHDLSQWLSDYTLRSRDFH
jgi:error-prone DNA polymerase